MKIGFITHQFPGVRGGGIGTYVLQAARCLAAAGHETHIFTLTLPGDSAGIREEQSAAGVQLHEVADLATRSEQGTLPPELAAVIEGGGEGGYRLALAWLLCEAARDFHRAHGLDIVEAPEYEALGLPFMIRPEVGLPVVTHLHLCSAIARAGNAAQKTPTSEDVRFDALESAAIRLADGVCAPTRYIVAETTRYLGVAPDAAIIPYPMQIPTDPRPLPEKGPILFVGRLEPRKGSALMAPAFNQFLARNPDAMVRLVGSDTQAPGGTGKPESVRAAIITALQPEVRSRVIFTGEQLPEQVRAEFAACRFSIVPSLFDNFPYTAVESLAAGRPVIASAETGTVEVVGEAGIAFPLGSAQGLAGAMEKLWRARALCQRLSQQAVARAQHLFSPENTIHARVAFYQRIIDNTRSGAARSSRFSVPEASLLEAVTLLTGAPAGTESATTETPGARLLALLQRIDAQGARVHLYGAGRHTSRLMAQRHLWESRGHRVIGLIDDHPRFASSPTHLGLPVQSVQSAIQNLTPADLVILSTDTFEDQFWQQTETLRAKGIAVHRLYSS